MHQQAGGQAMNKEEQVIMGFRDVYNKMVFLNKFKMEDSLKGYKSSEVHCIEYIGRNVDSNVTKLAESFYMTRGAISKLTKKLIKKGIIESYQKPDNKKEIYFRLTSQGKVIYKIHEELHKEFRERDKAVFEQVTEEQFDFMLRFVEKYSRHLDAEIKKQGVDITNRNDCPNYWDSADGG
jgi:DNA-binding MarR family transcriptional regulator